jgi:hypothetical protein
VAVPGRRSFSTSALAAIGVAATAGRAKFLAALPQAVDTSKKYRIDMHHHFGPPKRVAKLPNGVGVFSELSAKSAAANPCCRNLLPKTYAGSLPRVAVSENMTRGNRRDRASFTSAEAALVSASVALRCGFFSRAILTACARVRAGGPWDCWAKRVLAPLSASTTIAGSQTSAREFGSVS